MSYNVVRNPTVVPDTMYAKLDWHNQITWLPLQSTQYYSWAMNGMFDPDVTGGSSQPIGYDYYAQLYQRYEVLASSISIMAVNTQTNVMSYILFPSFTSVPNYSFNEAASQPYSRLKYQVTAGQVDRPVYIKHFMRVKKFDGRQTSSVNYTAPTVGANPTNIRYWVLRGQNHNAEDIAVQFIVKIRFYAKFFLRSELMDT